MVVYIQADENDADYVTSETPITEEDLETLTPIFEKIMARKGHNWEEAKEYLTKEEILQLDGLIPYPVYDGGEVHTIERIEVRKVQVIRKF